MNLKRKIKQFLERPIKRLLPNYVVFDQNRNDRSGALFKAWGHVITNKMGGGYYEFGIYKGSSFRESYRIYQYYSRWMKSQSQSSEMWRREINWDIKHYFYAFDTFEGMPENIENNETFPKGSFLSSLDEVILAGEKVGMFEGEKCQYFKGLFSEVAYSRSEEIINLKPAVIVNIDCDLYSSTVDALDMIKSKLQQGTIIMMDDWNCFSSDRSKGGRRALREFLEKNSDVEIEDYFTYSHAGKAFIVHLNK